MIGTYCICSLATGKQHRYATYLYHSNKYYSQTSSANRNAVCCGTSAKDVLLSVSETSQYSKCIGSKYPAESQQIIVCRSQRQCPIGDNTELRCSASRVYRYLAVAYPGFFSGCCPDSPANIFFRRQRDWAGPIWKPPSDQSWIRHC